MTNTKKQAAEHSGEGLAACPFCGKIPSGELAIFEADDIGGWLAGCCAQTWGNTRAEAITVWNTRKKTPTEGGVTPLAIWRMGYCRGAYRQSTTPPTFAEIDADWQKACEREPSLAAFAVPTEQGEVAREWLQPAREMIEAQRSVSFNRGDQRMQRICETILAALSHPSPTDLRVAEAVSIEDVRAIDGLLRYHETGGHEGHGTDADLIKVRAALSKLLSTITASSTTEGPCILCVAECRGHPLGDEEAWKPEPGSRAWREELAMTTIEQGDELAREPRNTADWVKRTDYNRLYQEFDAKCRIVNQQAAELTALRSNSTQVEDGLRERWITVWRKAGDKMLEWDFHVSEFADDLPRVVANLKQQGVKQYSTYLLGALMPEHTAMEYHPNAAALSATSDIGGKGNG